MFKLFAKKKKGETKELAPQLTLFERRALEFPGATAGNLTYSVLDQMQRDAMVQTALTIKKLGVLAADFKIVPAADTPSAREKAAFVEASFDAMEGSPRTILLGAMDAFAKGWSVQELVFESDMGGRAAALRAVRAKDPALFGLETDAFGTRLPCGCSYRERRRRSCRARSSYCMRTARDMAG